MIAGIDVGASSTKGVVLEGSEIACRNSVRTLDATSTASKVLESLLAAVGGRKPIGLVAASGGGSRKIGDNLLGLPVRRVDEIQAIGLGGLMLTRKRKGLVVSVGTGTAIVAVYDGGKRINHVGGTGVGGGTVLGISKRMLGVDDFTVLENMARCGDARKVDLTVADIVGGAVGIVPGEATASNFGRSNGSATENDFAAGIFNMVSQVIGVVAAMAARAYDLEEDVVLAGRLVKSRIVSEIIRQTIELFGARACVPEDCEFCTAVGAAGYILISENPRHGFVASGSFFDQRKV